MHPGIYETHRVTVWGATLIKSTLFGCLLLFGVFSFSLYFSDCSEISLAMEMFNAAGVSSVDLSGSTLLVVSLSRPITHLLVDQSLISPLSYYTAGHRPRKCRGAGDRHPDCFPRGQACRHPGA